MERLPTMPQLLRSNARTAGQLIALVVLTFAAYHQVVTHQFVWDTIPFVVENPWVHNLNGENFLSIFTEAHKANWQPIVWLSHSLDFYFFGTEPAGHHLVNVLLHLTNVFLVCYLVRLLLQKQHFFNPEEISWIAFLSAAAFAVHPQHVESVAWVVERKDVLYSVFMLGSMITYLQTKNHSSSPRLNRWLPFTLFLLAVASKPMAVTLPLVLLLMDCYPLQRLTAVNKTVIFAVGEKWHYFLVSLCVALITLKTQSIAMPTLDALPGWARGLNALDNTWFYLRHYLIPVNLSPLYPFPLDSMASIKFWGPGAVFLTGTSVISVILWRRMVQWPLMLLGFYVLTLLPVSGLIHVGPAKATDHYTYLSTLPFSLLIAVAIVAGFHLFTKFRPAILALTISYYVFLLLVCVQQVTYWNNPLYLWGRVVQLYPTSSLGHRNLAAAYVSIGDQQRALEHALISEHLGGPIDDYLEKLKRSIEQSVPEK